MEIMLEKNFDGRRLSIDARDGVKLDCMFFPFNDEKVLTREEMEKEGLHDGFDDIEERGDADPTKTKQYLKYPTVIIFNQNAQTYQQQVHAPNCFWLKYFLQNNFNVFTWNYRNYGRSEGHPDPYNCLHDSESILRFVV